LATGISATKWNGNNTNFNAIYDENISQNSEVFLSYEGKMSEQEILTLPSEKSVIVRKNKTGINRLYYGNNLPILLSLLKDSQVRGKVKLIYIDPPFATKSVFQSRSQIDAYSDLLSGSNYLEFLRKRLVILRELLAEDGSIYVHLDMNMAFLVKVIMDEIFGVNNFRSWITRQKCNPKNYTKKTYGNIADFILFYTKSNNYTFHRPFEDWTSEKLAKEYQYKEEKTGRFYKKVPLHAPGIRNGETGKPWRGIQPPPGKHWQFTPEKLEEMDRKGEIYWSKNGNPRRKVYLDESKGIPVQDIWLDFKDAHNQNIKITGYPTEKNPDLLSRIIQTSSDSNDLVLDCFAGSGTTLNVAQKLGRKWIGIDNSIEAIKTILKRFMSGCEKMGDFVSKNTQNNIEQLSLFEGNQEQSCLENNFSLNYNNPINDFTLYSLESCQNDLDTL
jgi:adenine-specific DNA-methyltransferase